MDSLTVKGAYVIYGNVLDDSNNPVMVSLLPTPVNRRGIQLDVHKVTSAYAKDNAQKQLSTSKVRYISPDKQITTQWSRLTRLQLPFMLTAKGGFVANNVPQFSKNGNSHSLDVDTEARYSNEVYDDEELTEVASTDRFLTKAVDVLKEGSKISSDIELDEKQVKKIAQEIVKEYSSDIPVKDLSENIYKSFAYMKKNGTSHEAMLGVMEQIARPVIESSKIVDSDLQEQFNNVRSYLKSHKITLNSQQRGDAASEFGSYNDFRKKAIGMMNIGNGGIALDSIWPELVEMSGNVLDITEPDASQPSALVNYMEGLRRTTNPYGQNIEEASLDLAMNIYGIQFIIYLNIMPLLKR